MSELPTDLQRELHQLGQRSRDTHRLRDALLHLCAVRPFTTRELAVLTGRNPAYLQQNYLNPMLREGYLNYRFPDEPNRPDQAYIALADQP